MSAIRIDFAVLGASTQARLVAGLLRSVHGKSVLYQGESQSAYRLPRGLDLSVAPLTRPETLALLQETVPQTDKIIRRLGGRGAVRRLDAVFCARSDEAVDALGHVRHMAQAFSFPAERMRNPVLGPGCQSILMRDSLLLHRASLEPILDRWLANLGVHRLATSSELVLKPDGSGVALAGDDGFEIAQTVLADDAAILAHVPEERWPENLTAVSASTLLSEPLKSPAAALVRQLDDDLILTQHARLGIAAIGQGSIEQVAEAMRALLGHENSMRQAGQSSYPRLVTPDGAAAVGRLAGTGPDVLAGLGTVGAFLAPAIARWLVGAASPAENNWLKARLVNRDSQASVVAEWGGTP